MAETSTKTRVPPPISTSDVPQVVVSATEGRLFAGLLSGGVELLRVGVPDAPTLLPLDGAVRALALPTAAPSSIVAATSAGCVTLLDVGKQSPVASYATADDRAPSALAGFADSHTGFVGDEAGGILSVDLRAPKPTAESFEHGDYVSSLHLLPCGNALLAASGDGTLGVYDARNPTTLPLAALSAAFNDDLCALAVDGTRALAGTLEGALHAFDVPQLKRLARRADDDEEEMDTRRFRGHPDAVNALALVSNVAVTACADGLLRAVDPSDGTLLALIDFDRSWAHAPGGPASDAAEGGSARKRAKPVKWPVEDVAVVGGEDGVPRLLALAGHEECVRFADLSVLVDSDREDEDGKVDEERTVTPPPEPERRKGRRKKKNATFAKPKRDNSFFDDL